jgi:hypothetical protein
MFDDSATDRREIDGVATQYNDTLVSIRPFFERQNFLKRVSTNYQHVYARHELIVAVRLAPALGKKVEIAVVASDKSIDARAYKHGCFHIQLHPLHQLR